MANYFTRSIAIDVYYSLRCDQLNFGNSAQELDILLDRGLNFNSHSPMAVNMA